MSLLRHIGYEDHGNEVYGGTFCRKCSLGEALPKLGLAQRSGTLCTGQANFKFENFISSFSKHADFGRFGASLHNALQT